MVTISADRHTQKRSVIKTATTVTECTYHRRRDKVRVLEYCILCGASRDTRCITCQWLLIRAGAITNSHWHHKLCSTYVRLGACITLSALMRRVSFDCGRWKWHSHIHSTYYNSAPCRREPESRVETQPPLWSNHMRLPVHGACHHCCQC